MPSDVILINSELSLPGFTESSLESWYYIDYSNSGWGNINFPDGSTGDNLMASY